MSGDLIEWHEFTSPLGAVQDHRPRFVNDLEVCIVSYPMVRGESLSRTAT